MRQRYRDRISGPLMDRIDLRITVPRIPADDLLKTPKSETSSDVRTRVLAARTRALERQNCANAQLLGQALRQQTHLSAGPEAFVRSVIKQLSLSGRSYDRLLRVARTVADLANEKLITESHLAEAVSYRELL